MKVYVVTVYYPYENNYIVGIYDSIEKADEKVKNIVGDLVKQYYEDYSCSEKDYEQIVQKIGDKQFLSYNVGKTIVTRKEMIVQ